MNIAAKAAKLALLGSFILQPALWDEQAEAWSKLLPHDWPGEHAGRLGAQVQAGNAHLLALMKDGERRGFLVYRIDRRAVTAQAAPKLEESRAELVIIAAYSGESREDVTAQCLGEIEAFARSMRCATVRFNTMRPGLIRKTLARGYRVSETIMRKDLV